MADSIQQIFINGICSAPLKISFLAHLFLTSLGMMGYWSRDSYFFYNLLFFLTLWWSITSKESDAPLMCLVINASAIVLDIFVLWIYFPAHGPADRFSAGMAILNLMLRPLSSIALHKVWKERNDASQGTTEAGQGSGYEGIHGATYG